MNRARLTLTAAIVLATGAIAGAHPSHFSFATAEWNAQSSRLEVALQMEAATLERAMRRAAKNETDAEVQRLTLESLEGAQFVREYVLQRFEIHTPAGNIAKIKWVGFEVSMMEAWVYFEVPVSEGPNGLRFQNRILFEEEPEQVNVVNLIAGGRSGTVKLSALEPKKVLVLTEKEN